MNVHFQILSLIYSSFMGLVLYVLCLFNQLVIIKKSPIWKYILTFIMIIDFSLIYIVGLYFVNGGILHPYFIFLIIIFFSISVKLLPIAPKNDNHFKNK